MKMVLAIIFPPLAVLICGKPFQALMNVLFCIIGVWIGGIIHAIYVINKSDQDRRHREMMEMMARMPRQ